MISKVVPSSGSPESLAARLNDDRRIGPRVALPRPALLRHADADVPVTVVDCSAIGIGLICDVEMPVDSPFVIRANAAVSLLAYRVANCRPTPDGRYRVGARLDACNLADPTVDDVVTALSSV